MEDFKRCSRSDCGRGLLPLSEFGLNKKRKDGHSNYCFECSKKLASVVYYRNRERILLRQQEARRNFTPEQREHERETNRRYYAANPDKQYNAWRRYYEKDKENYLAKQKEKDMENLEVSRAIQVTSLNNRRALRQGKGGRHTTKEWFELKEKYDFTCIACNKKEPEIQLTRDHVIPLRKGGTNDISNIQPLCVSCNSKKRQRPTDYR